jgi:predicted nucleic acid-binding protein
MKKVFVDTAAWVALKNERDSLHKKAQKLNKELLDSKHYYVTSNFVLSESYTLLVYRASHQLAVELGEEIRKSKLVEVIHINEEIERSAWSKFKKFSDKKIFFQRLYFICFDGTDENNGLLH